VITDPLDPLARFLLHRNDISPEHLRARPRAFLPDSRGETSVFRIGGLNDDEVWETGRVEVSQKRGLPLYGRADVTTASVAGAGLDVQSAEPPERHAVIVGWPPAKEERISLAQQLAAEAQLVLCSAVEPT
jgi:hypothetical protein